MPLPPTEQATPPAQPSPYPAQPDLPGAYAPQVEAPGAFPSQSTGPPDRFPGQAPLQPEESHYHYEDWSRTEETHSQSYGDPYWQGDSYAYGEAGGGAPPLRRRVPPRDRPRPRPRPEPPAPTAAGGRGPDVFESMELRPSLRRRVHPAPRAPPSPAFAAPSPAPLAAPVAPAVHSRASSGESVGGGRREAPRQVSDLDIQLAHGRRPNASPLASGPECALGAPPAPAYGAGRAPRCGRLISSTVDTWSRGAARGPGAGAGYKPLVFGGTYPIEVPTSPEDERPLRPTAVGGAPPWAAPRELIVDAEEHKRELRRTIERSLDRFEAILARRGPPSGAGPAQPRTDTFDIDAPLSAAEEAGARPRRSDVAYCVSGPHTFDIDEPY